MTFPRPFQVSSRWEIERSYKQHHFVAAEPDTYGREESVSKTLESVLTLNTYSQPSLLTFVDERSPSPKTHRVSV